MSSKDSADMFQNATVKEVIVAVLRAIRDSQKKLKVKTSKYLKQLEQFLFKVNTKKVTEEEFRLLLLGDEEKGLKYVQQTWCSYSRDFFIATAQNRNLMATYESHHITQQNSLYAFWSLIHKRQVQLIFSNIEFRNIYCDLEEDEFKLMNLSMHILSDNQNDMAAFQLIRFVKDKRPHISLSTIVDGRRVIEKFEQWYKDIKKVQVEEEIKQTTWVDEVGKKQQTEEDAMADQRDDQRKKKKKMLEHIQLNQSDKSAQFRIKTFSDPLNLDGQIKTDLSKSTKLKQRGSAQKRKQISNLMNLSVIPQSSIDMMRKKLEQNGFVLEDVIGKLHIDSEEFDPYVLIQALHNDTPNSQFVRIISKLENECMESKNLNQSLLYFFFEDLFLLNNGITKLHIEFVKREYESQQVRKQNSDAKMVLQDDLILGRLRFKNLNLLEELNVISNNLNAMKKNQFQLRQCLVFLQKFESLVRLPQLIKKAYVQQDYLQIVYLYQQNKLHIQKFKSLSIFQQLFQEIESNLNLCRKDVISQIKNEVSDFKHLTELVAILLDLPISKLDEPATNLKIQECEGSDGRVIHPTAQSIIQAIYQQLVQDSSQYLENEGEFEYSSNLEHTKIEKVQGDMMQEFLVDIGVVVKKTEKKKAGRNAVVLNCKAVEKYFQNKFLLQFSNFYVININLNTIQSLCMKFQSGELDYRMECVPNSVTQYAPGSTNQWKALIHSIFEGMVDRFLGGFERFMKRLQRNWFEDGDVGQESLKFYTRVKSDLQSMSSVLFHFEQILLATQYQISDTSQQRVLGQMKQLKTDMQILYMKILFEEYRNVQLNQLSLEETSIPQQDFFGVQLSPYMTEITEAIKSTFNCLGEFALHEGLFASNCELFQQYLVQLVQQALSKVKALHLTGVGEEQHRSLRRTRCLVFMHNLRMLHPRSKSLLLNQLIDDIYSQLSAHLGRKSEYSINMTKILNSLSINQRQYRRQSKAQISSFYGEFISSQKFQETAFQNITQMIEIVYSATLQLYITYLAPEFLPPQTQLPQVPRPYVYDWLDLLNQQVSQASLLHPVDPLLMDTLSAFVLTQFFKLISAPSSTVSGRSSLVVVDTKPSWKQLALEIQFYESVTVRMHGKSTKEGLEKLYSLLNDVAQVSSVENIFDEDQDLQTRQDMLRNAKFKMQYNFKALFAYF